MQRSKRSFPHLILVVLIVSALSCVVPGLASPNVEVNNTGTVGIIQDDTATIIPGITPSLTMTFTPTLIYLTSRFPSETPTQTLPPGTETVTPEVTVTFTPKPVVMRVSRPTHCRSGPGKSFEIVGSLLVGMKADVIGRDSTSQYWYIENPYVYTDYCWVWGEYAEFEGNQLLVPVVTSPSTPTSTGTAMPTLEFNLQGSGFQSCSGAFWMNIEITSESLVPFESVQVSLLDKDKNITRTLAANNFAAATNCDGLVINDTVTNGTAVLVSSARFDYNFKGNALRAYVTVCGQDDLKGTCTTREISLSP